MDTIFIEAPGFVTLQPAGLLQRLHTQARQFPDKAAVITADITLTYRALVEQAARLAQALTSLGVTQETPVAILLPPGIEQIISQTAILMAQGSCVPLDAAMPENRLNDMLDDLNVQWTLSLLPQQHKNLHTTLLDVEQLLQSQPAAKHISEISPQHRTHILFTSGTTGKPKAVEIEARGILRLVVNTHYVHFTPDDRIACISNPTFDASLFGIWGALLNGATTVIIAKKEVLNIHHFHQELVRQKITIMFITTTLFNLIATTAPETFRFFRYLLVGGEALNPHTVKLVLDAAPPEHLLNGYGPTESTTFALTHDIQLNDLTGGPVPIGRPIDATLAFVLDDHLLPVPPGDIGHLYIGGEGLARGYWNREQLNKERFINVTLPGYSQPVRLYRTGDFARQRADGVFLYHGRTDNQIKLRGHRIELEEIELQLLKSGLLKAATTVLVKNDHSDPFLAAFIVPLQQSNFDKNKLKRALQQYLPDYAVPQLVVVEQLPLTPTGKTDKHQLQAQLANNASPGVRPALCSDLEYALLLIWRKILNNGDIGLNDNFFQLGGSSLQAASLLIELGRQFRQQFSMQTLYEAPTLRQLARVIANKRTIRTEDETYQWQQDAQLPDDIQPLPATTPEWSHSESTAVLLTGATGFLGAFFLHDLLLHTRVKQVICLVRAASEAMARQRIQDNLAQYQLGSPAFNQRIAAICGDLALPKFGLSDALYHQLAMESDVIFHLGAHVNYIQPYQAHRAANIEGTWNILRLATSIKPKPLHYVSTIAAWGPAGLLHNVKRIYENDDLKPYLEGMKYDSGYSQSQWVVEQFIWKAKQRGIPLAVYRPGFIMGNSVNGVGNPKDFVSRLIRGCIAIGAYPTLPRQRKEFIPVDYVSRALLIIARDNRNLGQAYHLVPPDHRQSIDLDQFFLLLSECGYPLQKLSYDEWIKRLEADPRLMENPLMPLLPMLAETVYQKQTRWQVYENMPEYDTSNTMTALLAANSPLKFTPMNKTQLRLHLNFLQQGGFLPDYHQQLSHAD